MFSVNGWVQLDMFEGDLEDFGVANDHVDRLVTLPVLDYSYEVDEVVVANLQGNLSEVPVVDSMDVVCLANSVHTLWNADTEEFEYYVRKEHIVKVIFWGDEEETTDEP